MRLLIIGFLMMLVFGAHAYEPQMAKDSSKVTLRKFDEKAIQKYRTQKAFIYDDVAPQSESLWSRFWRWFWGIINRVFSGKISGKIINYLLTAAVILLTVFIIIKLTGLDYNVFARKSKTMEVPFEESLENIHEIDFDEQIENAILSSNYRLAVRLLYLKTLKRLSDEGLIAWKAEKTNQAYVIELSNDHQKNDFTELTYQFEYIWYGEFFIDKTSFGRIYDSFKRFNGKMP